MALSDEQIVQLSLEWPAETNDWASHIDFARSIEAEVRKECAAELAALRTERDHMEMAANAEARRVDELTELRKEYTELIQQLVEALESVDAAMPFPVARQVLKVARARLEQLNHH